MKFVKLMGVAGYPIYVSPVMIVESDLGESTKAAKTRITCNGTTRFVTDSVEDVVTWIEATFP